MSGTGRNEFFTCIFIIFLGMTVFGFDAMAMQPYQDFRFEEVAQGTSQCGPTSFYMIFNHLGVHQVFKEYDLSEHPEDMAIFNYKVTDDTAICRWVNNGRESGTSWSMLKAAADNLHAQGATRPYFTSELNSTTTSMTTAGNAEREKRLNYIRAAYLDKDRAVIIHMQRAWYLSGHYLVLTGYDPARNMVYYADPINGSAGEISKDSFIRDKWYVSPSNPADYYRARWDGEWLGFFILQ